MPRKSDWVWVPVVSGPLAPHAAGFERWLLEHGFARSAVGNRLWQFAHLSRWMEREGLAPGELTVERVEEFVAAHRSAGFVTFSSVASMRLPVAYLRGIGAAPLVPVVVADGALDVLLGGYRRYMVRERGLVEHTIYGHQRVARLFLEGRPADLELERLSAADVSAFLASECPKRSVSGARDLVFALRSLLRYLHVCGLIDVPLVWAVPGVAEVRDRSLPRGLEPQVLARILDSCDRRTLVGQRDHAVLLLLSRLGLRAGEVAALSLEDLDWRRGELTVHGKGSRLERLPIPVDVGEAVVGYLRARGRVEGSRAVFVTMRAPVGGLSARGVISVVARACARADVPVVGAHVLRHTAATGMLRAGASLPEIAQVLRHRRIETTTIYARVDRDRLLELARPWPGAAA